MELSLHMTDTRNCCEVMRSPLQPKFDKALVLQKCLHISGAVIHFDWIICPIEASVVMSAEKGCSSSDYNLFDARRIPNNFMHVHVCLNYNVPFGSSQLIHKVHCSHRDFFFIYMICVTVFYIATISSNALFSGVYFSENSAYPSTTWLLPHCWWTLKIWIVLSYL